MLGLAVLSVACLCWLSQVFPDALQMRPKFSLSQMFPDALQMHYPTDAPQILALPNVPRCLTDAVQIFMRVGASEAKWSEAVVWGLWGSFFFLS